MHMKKYFNLNIIMGAAITVVCLCSNNVMADCDSTEGVHYPGLVPPNSYGNAQTDSFNCAINGSKQLTMDQINSRSDLIPPSLNNRFYVMLGINAGAEGLISGSNIATANNTSTGAIGTLSETQVKVASNNFEIGFGYTWKDFAIDLEWFAVKSITLNSSIIGITPTFSFTSTVKGDSLLFNSYWFFNDMYNAKLYGIFTLGYNHNQSYTTIGSGATNVMNRYYAGGGLGIGARFNIIASLYADLAGRALYLGHVKMQATDGNNFLDVTARRVWVGASFRLLWLI